MNNFFATKKEIIEHKKFFNKSILPFIKKELRYCKGGSSKKIHGFNSRYIGSGRTVLAIKKDSLFDIDIDFCFDKKIMELIEVKANEKEKNSAHFLHDKFWSALNEAQTVLERKSYDVKIQKSKSVFTIKIKKSSFEKYKYSYDISIMDVQEKIKDIFKITKFDKREDKIIWNEISNKKIEEAYKYWAKNIRDKNTELKEFKEYYFNKRNLWQNDENLSSHNIFVKCVNEYKDKAFNIKN